MPISRAERITRMAISPRLATNIFLIIVLLFGPLKFTTIGVEKGRKREMRNAIFALWPKEDQKN